MPPPSATSVRQVKPDELRTLVRFQGRYYNNVVVAAIYSFEGDLTATQLTSIDAYSHALHQCLSKHPFLSAIVRKDGAGRYEYARVSQVNVAAHFNVLDVSKFHCWRNGNISSASEMAEERLLDVTLEYICNDKDLTFFDTYETLPGWRIDVLPLQPKNGRSRAFVSFAHPHYNLDGMSAIAFHKTFLNAMNESVAAASEGDIFRPAASSLPCFASLPVSWSYLLTPALSQILPSFVLNALGIKASVSGSDEKTWTAGKMSLDTLGEWRPPATGCIATITIESDVLTRVLQACRTRQTTLTPLLHEILVLCFSRRLPDYLKNAARFDNFISLTPTDLRRTAGFSGDVMGQLASACYIRHKFDHSIAADTKLSVNDQVWAQAQEGRVTITQSANTTKNQPIGLMKYVSNMESWYKDKIGQDRDSSWEISNLGAVDGNGGRVQVETMIFSQSACPTGQAVSFNIVSVKGGSMTISTSWQLGALALDRDHTQAGGAHVESARVASRSDSEAAMVEATERNFIEQVLDDLKGVLHDTAKV